MASPAALVQLCAPADVDAVTGACAAPVWVYYQPGLLPPLTVGDALILLSATLTLLVIAWGWKKIGQSVANRW